MALLCASDLYSQEPRADVPPEPAIATKDEAKANDELRFSFDGTPWREVIKWLADESNLALHIDDLPTGSFTYSDPDPFTQQEAIDRVNLFLLSQGFTLVRSGKLLSVLNLADPRSLEQLDALAKLVTVEQLATLPAHDVVKCVFPLGDLKAEDAVEELTALKLMTTPAVFTKTNRLLITDSVAKLRSAKSILDAFEPKTLDNGTTMKNFALKHVEAEDILLVARPHLGLATGEMIGIDVSMSADLPGKNIFVTGVEDKVKLIEGLVEALDKPQSDSLATDGKSELQSYVIPGGNVETVYNVLLTLLAEKPVRLSMDEEAESIVALAAPEIQKEIAATVNQLQATSADFEVIPLKTVDPYFAISLLEEMLDLPDPLLDDPDDIDPDAPKIDADPGNMRLYVRAKKHDIEQIKKIVAGLDEGTTLTESDETISVFPLKGEQAERILETAATFWRMANPVVYYPPMVAPEKSSTERVVAEPGTTTNKPVVPKTTSTLPNVRFLTKNPLSKEPVIRCQLTPRGLLLQCEDTKALAQFEEHLRTIAGPVDTLPAPPIVFYLKYTKPDDAIRMLAEMLDGGEAAKEGEAGSLVNGYVSGTASTFLGSLIMSRQGSLTMTAGTITVVADTRLNRLIAQGTEGDIEQIEGYLKIIDKDSSITDIQTHGTAHVIELRYTKAAEVATAIREAYAGRVTASTATARPGQPGAGSQDPRLAAAKAAASKGDRDNGKSDKKKSQAAQTPGRQGGTVDLEPKMTIAIHEPSNSLIVTAPEALFKEIEQLVKLIDSRNEQVVEVVAPPSADVIDALMRVISGEAAPGGGRSRTPSSSPRAPMPSPFQPGQGGKGGR